MHKTLSLGYTCEETEDCKKKFIFGRRKWGLCTRGWGYTSGTYYSRFLLLRKH